MLITKPPMGWNSWNTFMDKIDEKTIMETADAMVNQGLLKAGYEYLVIDDSWAERERDAEGRLKVNYTKFPNGMKAVADYVHSKGLKFGMYSCAGVRTCMCYPGSFGHEFQDARFFADIGVDYLKYDYCFRPALADGPMLYNRMGMALRAAGRDILFSACNWGKDNTTEWIRSTGAHMFRSTTDIMDSYQSMKNIALSQLSNLPYTAPGCFNDLDMLIVGLHGKGCMALGADGCSDIEYRQHFAFWCMLSAPLMIGADVRDLSPDTLALLTNRELLAIDQDPEVRPPYIHGQALQRPECAQEHIVLLKHLADGNYAAGYFNFGDQEANIPSEFYNWGIDISSGCSLQFSDVFTGEDMGIFRDFYRARVPAHDCRLYKVRLIWTGRPASRQL